MPLVPVQNRKPGPTHFTNMQTQDSINWEGAGDPSGADVQFVPEEYLSLPAFVKAMEKGVFQIMTDSDGDQARDRAVQTAQYQQADEQRRVEESIKRENTRDIVQVDCIGPSPRGVGAACGTPVPVYATQVGKQPPLCGMHESMAHEYVPLEGEVGPDGKAVVQWVRAQPMAPNRSAML